MTIFNFINVFKTPQPSVLAGPIPNISLKEFIFISGFTYGWQKRALISDAKINVIIFYGIK